MLANELETLEAEAFEVVTLEEKPMAVAGTTVHSHTPEGAWT